MSEMNPPKIPGLQFEMDENGKLKVYGVEETSREAFVALLEWLPCDYELSFYDRFFPSPSDPGAYVSVQREEDRYAYMMGNHGWSAEWRSQSLEMLASYLHLNRSVNDPFSDYKFPVSIARAGASAWKPQKR